MSLLFGGKKEYTYKFNGQRETDMNRGLKGSGPDYISVNHCKSWILCMWKVLESFLVILIIC